MPEGPHSTASDIVIAWSAVFAIAEGTTKAEPVHAQVTRLLTTAPLMPSSIQRLPSASVTWKLPSITVEVMARKPRGLRPLVGAMKRSEEHTSELQSLMRISYAVFCLKKKKISSPEDSTFRNQ